MPKNPETLTYKVLLQNLEKRFSQRKFYFVERGSTALLKMPGRVSASFAASCKFGSELNIILRDIFVNGLTTKEVSERLQEVDAINLDVNFGRLLIWLL